MKNILATIGVVLVFAQSASAQSASKTSVSEGWVTVAPSEFNGAINNPLKGFRDYKKDGYGLLKRTYIKWSDIEVCEGDTVDRIIAHTRKITEIKGKRFEDLNIKLVPRVYLDWDGSAGKQYWPADMHTFDYDSPAFQQRLERLVAKLGEAWDDDPRIFAVQMGLIGHFGEHHNPAPTIEQRKLLAEAFQKAFKNKPVLVRHNDAEFMQAGFGIYYDTFANLTREPPAGPKDQFPWQATNVYRDIWKLAPIEGEVEYNWQQQRENSKPNETFGRSPDETMTVPAYRHYMIDKIRRYHASYLGWIHNYNDSNSEVLAGADEIQKAFGYRYVLDSVSYPFEASPGENLTVKLTARNTGSAPFYLDWPVAVGLLDPETKKLIWSSPLAGIDIRKWLPGEDWDSEKFVYRVPAATYQHEGHGALPADLTPGKYILALAILDRQGGMMPSVRFAIENYFRGGWHPLGFIGIGQNPGQAALNDMKFDSPAFDDSLHYKVPERLLLVKTPPIPQVNPVTPAKDKGDALAPIVLPRMADGKGTVAISGELRAWHKVTLTLDGPYAHELDNEPNPFTDINLTVTFTHESGAPIYKVPGYFATDGNASESSAESGTKWRAHLAPDKSGTWNYSVSFTKGKHAALDGGGTVVKPFDGLSGNFKIADTNKKGRDFRAHGRLQYIGKHHLQFAGSKQFFLKVGADSPETLLAYADFDNTQALKKNVPLKTWKAHVQDFHKGDPTWKNDKGQGLIGALNYLSAKGVNAVSFLTYNAGGDGNNIWPFVERDAKLHYDCSKLDQWGIVLDHATAKGLYLHFKLQENEIDDNRRGENGNTSDILESLDGGKLGPQRKLYCREVIARYAHNLALNWNICEESTQSTGEINDMINYINANDPYKHLVVIHTFPNQQDKVYTPLLGEKSKLTGASLQNAWNVAHQRTLNWVTASAVAGKPWIVANDEQNGADTGVPPDIGYNDYKGKKKDGKSVQTTDDIRQLTLWGNLMAGGAGVEYYFGYQLAQNDLIAEDWRSREKSWDYGRIALDFFRDNQIPFWEMKNANALIGNTQNDNSKYCLAKAGECYLVYLPKGGETQIDLLGIKGKFSIKWFNPREGGALKVSGRATIDGGSKAILTSPSADDWLAVIAKE